MPAVRGYFELTRLHKPLMGNTLMFWPCGKSSSRQGMTRITDPPRLAWGLTIAARATTLPLVIFAEKLVWFGLGSMLLHSSACVLNDICDVEFDRQVGTPHSAVLPGAYLWNLTSRGSSQSARRSVPCRPAKCPCAAQLHSAHCSWRPHYTYSRIATGWGK